MHDILEHPKRDISLTVPVNKAITTREDKCRAHLLEAIDERRHCLLVVARQEACCEPEAESPRGRNGRAAEKGRV